MGAVDRVRTLNSDDWCEAYDIKCSSGNDDGKVISSIELCTRLCIRDRGLHGKFVIDAVVVHPKTIRYFSDR